MASDGLDSSPSAGKHRHSRASGDAAADESSKRRKHHHHSHHHHHRRRHSKHGHDRDDGDDNNNDLPLAAEATKPQNDDDEREEGEILEEEEEGEIRLNPGCDIERVVDSVVTNLSEKSSIRPCNYISVKDDEKMEHLSVAEEAGEIDIPEFRITLNDHDEIGSDREARRRPPKSRRRGADKENKHMDVDKGDLKSRARSSSPVSGENSHMAKHERSDEVETRALDRHSGRLEKRRHLETWNGDGKASDGNSRYKDTKSSPEARHRDRSRSHNHKRERSYESGREPNVDISARSHNSESQVNSRSDPEHQRSVRHDRADHYAVRSRDDDKYVRTDRERSISHSRYDTLEDRHCSWDRGSDRERYGRSVRERDSKEVDKDARRERERSSSYSMRDNREDRHSSRDRGRDRERYNSYNRDNDRDKPRDTSRERYKERERPRDANSERERLRSSVDRDRISDRDYRERREQMEKDRISNRDLRHNDSRHSYGEKGHHNDRRRPNDVKSDTRNSGEGNERSTREENEEVYLEKIEEELAKREEDDVDKIKEESRKRRQAILEKYKQQQMQQRSESPCSDHDKEKHTPADKDNQQPLDAENAASQVIHKNPDNEHDPSDLFIAEPSFAVGKSDQNGASDRERIAGAGGLGEGSPKSERSEDMFCDDIFAESPAGVRKHGKGDAVQVVRSGLHDNWDDADGYYSYRLGEVLDGHFEIKAFHGKGVFSTVVRAKDLKAGKGEPEEVAIKIIRNNDTMYKAGLEELVILKKLAGADPEDKRHCVRFLSNFKYRNHLCLVFESLHMNLREVLKKFGRNIGLNLTAVRAYAKQLFVALKHLRNCGVLHCDIKPDNMLVNEAKNVLKLCDFGNAMFAGKNEITPYLVSRFYRAPEIILGLPYDHPMDIWSVGCCLYEIYTGKVLFPGPSNNDMLRLHMELKGPFPKKMLRKGGFTDRHFDQDLNFHASEEDPVTKKSMKRLILSIKPKEIGTIISSSPGEDPKLLTSFKDLLERIFILDPEKRMTVAQALSHPFITGK